VSIQWGKERKSPIFLFQEARENAQRNSWVEGRGLSSPSGIARPLVDGTGINEVILLSWTDLTLSHACKTRTLILRRVVLTASFVLELSRADKLKGKLTAMWLIET
jgi:hypothetical protein